MWKDEKKGPIPQVLACANEIAKKVNTVAPLGCILLVRASNHEKKGKGSAREDNEDSKRGKM